jgi:hypothetical protein
MNQISPQTDAMYHQSVSQSVSQSVNQSINPFDNAMAQHHLWPLIDTIRAIIIQSYHRYHNRCTLLTARKPVRRRWLESYTSCSQVLPGCWK